MKRSAQWTLLWVALGGCDEPTGEIVTLECRPGITRPCPDGCKVETCTAEGYWGRHCQPPQGTSCPTADAGASTARVVLLECEAGDTRPCHTECGIGTITCMDSGYWGLCNSNSDAGCREDAGSIEPVGCPYDGGCACHDGERRSCSITLGECSRGEQICSKGAWGQCTGREAEVEECDNVDNDCDGDVDEGCDCEKEQSVACGTELGECTRGVQICDGNSWSECSGRGPEAEICDGEDNDCDGDIDEGCDCLDGSVIACGLDLGLCRRGQQHCAGGRWQPCDANGPESESCDGEDNDCDGDVDEGCACVDGDSIACGTSLGACAIGTQECANGTWGACDGTPPEVESCDDRDNDCDGDIDERCECPNGAIRECSSSIGTCESGTQQCVGGVWGACEVIGRDVEVCDGLDNNCDGNVDEGCECKGATARECGTDLGNCTLGTQSCVDGLWGRCDAVRPATEACDGDDNDCDGDVDEGCECRHGATQPCEAGLGACAAGTQTCKLGSWGVCSPGVGPQTERCDGLDDDCDGAIDNGFQLERACDSTGKCPASRQCNSDGTASACVTDQNLFEPERCDGVDNDCDGLVDRVSENGSLRSVCACETRALSFGDAVDASVAGGVQLCADTQCSNVAAKLQVDGTCYDVCQTDSDPDGDGWGWENGRTCIVEDGPAAGGAVACAAGEIEAAAGFLSYCLDCAGSLDLPFAMCQSQPRYDFRAFARGEQWLRVDYTYDAEGPAGTPVNLWFYTGEGRRKRLPLVGIGDTSGRSTKVLRVDEACFTPGIPFGENCSAGQGTTCSHCGAGEICGALDACGQYDLSQAWLQIAAEFCPPLSGQQQGRVTVHEIELVEANCVE